MQGCKDARMLQSKDVAEQGCKDARMQGCKDVAEQGRCRARTLQSEDARMLQSKDVAEQECKDVAEQETLESKKLWRPRNFRSLESKKSRPSFSVQNDLTEKRASCLNQ
jgi:hypothetical protein